MRNEWEHDRKKNRGGGERRRDVARCKRIHKIKEIEPEELFRKLQMRILIL